MCTKICLTGFSACLELHSADQAMRNLFNGLAGEGAFDPDTIQVMTDAFERAWSSLQASGAPFSVAEYAETARDILARHIIKAARNGERDQQQLCQGALLQLAKTGLRTTLKGSRARLR
jgi:hypothetical protein